MDSKAIMRSDEIRSKLERLFDRYGVKNVPPSISKEMVALRDELEALVSGGEAAETKRRAEKMNKYLNEPANPMQHPSAGAKGGGAGYGGRSLGDAFVDSAAFKDKGSIAELDVELKTLFQTTAGWAPESLRSGRVIEDEQRPIQLIDVIPQTETNQAAYVYMEETTFTSAAAEAAEGGTFAESALALTEKTNTVRKIATWLPVTDEQLADVAQARDYVNSRLIFMLRQRLDGQILNGDGVAPNLTGILNVSGIQTQAKGADPVPDAIRKAIDKVRLTGRASPNAVILHPNDAQELALLRTADGLYIWGHPSGPGPDRIWGVPIVISDVIAENTGLVGDFRNFSLLAVRRGVEVEVSESHGTFFIEGKLAIRAQLRVAFVTLRPTSFCTITGI